MNEIKYILEKFVSYFNAVKLQSHLFQGMLYIQLYNSMLPMGESADPKVILWYISLKSNVSFNSMYEFKVSKEHE